MYHLILESFLVIICIYGIHGLSGPNVCTKVEEYPKEIQVIVKEPFEIRTFGWCAKIPPRCRKVKMGYRDVVKNETRVMRRNVETCCTGYVESNNRCLPVCRNACIHGTCVAPNECDCDSGWGGSTCNISCDKHRWGPRCENQCKCGNDSRCDPITGKCICAPGEIRDDCVYACECFNGATCDPKVGKCECRPGFMGQMCESSCSVGRYGKYCSEICDCLNGAACSWITGQCFCAPGYYGKRCEIQNCTELGDKCSSNHLQLVSTNDVEVKESKGSSLGMILAITTLLLVLLVASLLFVLKYKQKLHSLKNELAFVTYVAEKPTDRFANPVYDYQTPKVQTVVCANPSLGVNLKNDLSCYKTMDKNEFFNDSYSDSVMGATGGGYSYNGSLEELKIKDVNYNPNIYHNLDDWMIFPPDNNFYVHCYVCWTYETLQYCSWFHQFSFTKSVSKTCFQSIINMGYERWSFVLCIFCCSVHLIVLTKAYLCYNVITKARIVESERVVMPTVTLCIHLNGDYNKSADGKINARKEANHGIKDILGFTLHSVTNPRTGTLIKDDKAFEVLLYTIGDKLCKSFKPTNPRNHTYYVSKLSHAQIQGSLAAFKVFGDKQLIPQTWFLSLTVANRIPRSTIGNFWPMERAIGKGFLVHYKIVKERRLPPPYSTKCRYYDKEGKGSQKQVYQECLNKLLMPAYGNCIISQSLLLWNPCNGTNCVKRCRIADEVLKLARCKCKRIARRQDCIEETYTITSVRSLNIPHNHSFFAVYAPNEPVITTDYLAEYSFMSYSTAFGSILGYWLGLDVLLFNTIVLNLFCPRKTHTDQSVTKVRRRKRNYGFPKVSNTATTWN